MNKKVQKIADLEVTWWQAHHRKNMKLLTDSLVEQLVLLFSLSLEKAKIAAEYKIQAARHHDIAEDYEDSGHKKEADLYWKKAEECLRKYYECLEIPDWN
jgi:hypothetical protein